MKMNRNFNELTDFESLELEVPTFCFVTGCVSAYRDRRYIVSSREPLYSKGSLKVCQGFIVPESPLRFLYFNNAFVT